jgi:uncharacterized protein YjiS (DUF1127 family)
MTALERRTTYAGAAPLRTDVMSRMVKGLHAILRAMVNRRHLGNLNELSDHQLADIGLTRGDLYAARHTRILADPTSTLSALSRQRRYERLARRIC